MASKMATQSEAYAISETGSVSESTRCIRNDELTDFGFSTFSNRSDNQLVPLDELEDLLLVTYSCTIESADITTVLSMNNSSDYFTCYIVFYIGTDDTGTVIATRYFEWSGSATDTNDYTGFELIVESSSPITDITIGYTVNTCSISSVSGTPYLQLIGNYTDDGSSSVISTSVSGTTGGTTTYTISGSNLEAIKLTTVRFRT